MKLQAMHNIVLPDGRQVKSGDMFNYEGDIKAIEAVVAVMSEPEKAKTEKTKPEKAKTEAKNGDNGETAAVPNTGTDAGEN